MFLRTKYHCRQILTSIALGMLGAWLLFAPQGLAQESATAPFVQSYRVESAAEQAKMKSLVDRLTAAQTPFRQIYDHPTRQWIVVAPTATQTSVSWRRDHG
ncbi:MAG: hypothetical protein MI865_04350 [Proteobacteria bacterium]|nr:hypothetical protein [Pseudomonadota bacterium]